MKQILNWIQLQSIHICRVASWYKFVWRNSWIFQIRSKNDAYALHRLLGAFLNYRL